MPLSPFHFPLKEYPAILVKITNLPYNTVKARSAHSVCNHRSNITKEGSWNFVLWHKTTCAGLGGKGNWGCGHMAAFSQRTCAPADAGCAFPVQPACFGACWDGRWAAPLPRGNSKENPSPLGYTPLHRLVGRKGQALAHRWLLVLPAKNGSRAEEEKRVSPESLYA